VGSKGDGREGAREIELWVGEGGEEAWGGRWSAFGRDEG